MSSFEASDIALRQQLDRFRPYEWLYQTARFGGSDDIIKQYLDLPTDFVLPLTIPHGIETGTNPVPEDIFSPEPIYLAVTESVRDLASPYKNVLEFPHPWLMLPPAEESGSPKGTLFIASPSSPQNNLNLLEGIRRIDLPKPWGIILKYRGLDRADFEWWEAHGFTTHTAGLVSTPSFYIEQRRILQSYESVALPYLSSIGVFAAHLERNVFAIPNVECWIVTGPDYDHIKQGRDIVVRSTWSRLLSNSPEAKEEADRLLGMQYLIDKNQLRRKLLESISTAESPVYFPHIKGSLLRRLAIWAASNKIPAHKILPNPISVLMNKVRYLANLNKVGVMVGSEFSHFGVVGESRPFSFSHCLSYQTGWRSGLGDGPKKVPARRTSSGTIAPEPTV